MNRDHTNWIFPPVLFAFALTGIIFAIRGEYLLSGIFALFFLGYFVIRASDKLKRPLVRIPRNVRHAGFVLIIAGYSFYLLYLIFRRL
jgi:hypothetical protein